MKYIVYETLNDQQYKKLLNFAFLYSEHFSICTFKYHRKNLSDEYYSFMNEIEKYRKDKYEFILPKHYEKGQKYHVYSLNEETKKCICKVQSIYSWHPPCYPEDLSFYHQKNFWMNFISHEKIILVNARDRKIINLFHELGIPLIEDI